MKVFLNYARSLAVGALVASGLALSGCADVSPMEESACLVLRGEGHFTYFSDLEASQSGCGPRKGPFKIDVTRKLSATPNLPDYDGRPLTGTELPVDRSALDLSSFEIYAFTVFPTDDLSRTSAVFHQCKDFCAALWGAGDEVVTVTWTREDTPLSVRDVVTRAYGQIEDARNAG